MKEQKKNKGRILVAESTYISQKAQFGLVMKGEWFETHHPLSLLEAETKFSALKISKNFPALSS